MSKLDRQFPYKTLERAAKDRARSLGHEGRKGGWIYNAEGRVICQGWGAYGARLQRLGRIIGDWKTGYRIVEIGS